MKQSKFIKMDFGIFQFFQIFIDVFSSCFENSVASKGDIAAKLQTKLCYFNSWFYT